MKFLLDCFWVDFNNCRFGLAVRPPVLMVEPAEFEADDSGRCEITRADKVTLRIDLKYLDSGFTYLWNSRGELTGLQEEAYLTPGELVIGRCDPELRELSGESYRCSGARLLHGAAYCAAPGQNGCYRLEFELTPPAGTPYMERR